MIIITIHNEKGGVGKTTTATTLAAGLAHRGARVLLVDADAQGNATLAVGHQKQSRFYDWLVRNAKPPETLLPVDPQWHNGGGTLWLIASNEETMSVANSISNAGKIRDNLQSMARAFDVCIIDTGPQPSLLHGAIYYATDYIIHPTLCEKWSMNGLAESWKHTGQANQAMAAARPEGIRLLGIQPIRYRKNLIIHSENLESIQAYFPGLVWEPIAERVAWPEAHSMTRPVMFYDPDGEAALEAWALVDRVVGVVNGQAR